MERSNLELVVGIDFGFTCTGVAYYPPLPTYLRTISGENDESYRPTIIPDWPENRANTTGGHSGVTNKVPTRLAYRGGVAEYRWGFDCPPSGEYKSGYNVQEHFKLCLEKEFYDATYGEKPGPEPPGSFEDVQCWFKDFLKALYGHVVSYFAKVFRDPWETARVEYIFSIPTVWAGDRERKPVTELFEDIIRKAGFGSIKNQTVSIGLSEAKAAAIYTAMFPKDHRFITQPDASAVHNGTAAATPGMVVFEKGDVLLVCDAGGGTTDVCVLEVLSDKDKPIELGQLSQVNGIAHGSVQIDYAFQKEAERRLSPNKVKDILSKEVPRLTPRNLAKEMTRGDFQFKKHNCGGPLHDLDTVAIKMREDIPLNLTIDSVPINKRHMIFTKDDIEGMFNGQVENIERLIQEQLDALKESGSGKEVTYIVLAGGLGSSPYVQKRLWATYSHSQMKILASEEPQLAVCKGLVIDRIHRLRTNSSALRIRRSPASYGVLVKRTKGTAAALGGAIKARLLGKKEDRAEEERVRDTFKPIEIRWFVKKGQVVEESTCRLRLSRTDEIAAPQKVWAHKILCSHADERDLPLHFPYPGGQVIAMMEVNLVFGPYARLKVEQMPGVKEVPKKLFNPTHSTIEYEVCARIVAGGLEFRVRLVGGQEGEWVGGRLLPILWPILPELEGKQEGQGEVNREGQEEVEREVEGEEDDEEGESNGGINGSTNRVETPPEATR